MKVLFSGLLLAGISLAGSVSSNGQAFAVTSVTGGSEFGFNPSTYGWRFTVGSQALNVTDVGLIDLDVSGFAESHRVGIWDSVGNAVADVTFAAGQTGTLVNGFRYLSVSGVTLQAGQSYSIGVYSSGSSDPWAYSTTATFSSDLTYDGAGSAAGVADAFLPPTESHSWNYGVFGGNFQYQTASPVPEPGEYMFLAGVGLAAFAGCRRLKALKLMVA